MPLLSTRASASAAGYGQGLNSARDVFIRYGQSQYISSSEYPLDYWVSPDGGSFFASTVVYGTSGYTWRVYSYSRDVSTGKLTYVASYVLSGTSIPNTGSTCFLAVSPDSKNLYASISGLATSTLNATNRVYQFSIDATTKELTALSTPYIDLGTGAGVAWPKHSTDGNFLYVGSQATNKIYIFSRNATTGLLTFSTTFFTPTNTKPYCPIISDDNSFLYSSSWGTDTSNAIVQYSRNSITGNLTALSPEGVSGGTQMQYLNFNAAQVGLHCASIPAGLVYIYGRNETTGLLTLAASQGGALYQVSFSLDGTTMLGVNSNDIFNTTKLVTQTPFQGTISSGTGAVTPYENPKFVALWAGAGFLRPSPSYDYYYSCSAGIGPVQWQLTGGYLEPVEFPSPKGGALNVYLNGSGNTRPTYTALSPDGTSVYTNSYWPVVSGTNKITNGCQFDVDAVTGLPTRSTALSYSTQQGNGGISISPDSSFLYIVDGSVNPPVVRQYSRNTSNGNLTALGTPTINLPTPYAWSLSQPPNMWSWPAMSNDGKNLYITFSSSGKGSPAIYIPYIIQYSRDTVTGQLTLIGTVNIGSFAGATNTYTYDNLAPQVLVHPNDNFVYALDALGVTIFVFSRDLITGALTEISSISSPAYGNYASISMCITPDGLNLYKASQLNTTSASSAGIDMFSIDTITGALSYLGKKSYLPNENFGRISPTIVSMPDSSGVVVFGDLYYSKAPSGILNSPSKPFNWSKGSSAFGAPVGFYSISPSKKIYGTGNYLMYGTINA